MFYVLRWSWLVFNHVIHPITDGFPFFPPSFLERLPQDEKIISFDQRCSFCIHLSFTEQHWSRYWKGRDEMIVFRVMVSWKRKTIIIQNERCCDTFVFWRVRKWLPGETVAVIFEVWVDTRKEGKMLGWQTQLSRGDWGSCMRRAREKQGSHTVNSFLCATVRGRGFYLKGMRSPIKESDEEQGHDQTGELGCASVWWDRKGQYRSWRPSWEPSQWSRQGWGVAVGSEKGIQTQEALRRLNSKNLEKNQMSWVLD